jgi:hypothetical protein
MATEMSVYNIEAIHTSTRVLTGEGGPFYIRKFALTSTNGECFILTAFSGDGNSLRITEVTDAEYAASKLAFDLQHP